MNTDPFIVTTPAQLRALASPVRSQIMDILRQGKEMSVSELASLVGASGSATHYQVDRLVEVGLVVCSGKRRVGPRSEAVYRSVSTRIQIPARRESPEYMEALLALVTTALRKVEREIVEAHRAKSGSQDSPAVRVVERKGYVKPEDLPRLYALLKEAADLIKQEGTASEDIRLGLHAFAVRLPSE